MVDRNEAPKGYYAVKKEDYNSATSQNYCKSCDWRKNCDSKVMRCHGGEVGKDSVAPRKDGESVIFKKI